MAATLKDQLGVDTQLVVGNSGEFTVWFGNEKVAEKQRGVFPEPSDVVTAVRVAMSNALS